MTQTTATQPAAELALANPRQAAAAQASADAPRPQPGLVILYVDQPLASAAFYGRLLGCEAIESSPTFAMLPLAGGLALGLWQRQGVVPATRTGGGGGELALMVADAAAVEATHAAWLAQGITVTQPPTHLDFGHSFVALDPDGHRVRVMAPGPGPDAAAAHVANAAEVA